MVEYHGPRCLLHANVIFKVAHHQPSYNVVIGWLRLSDTSKMCMRDPPPQRQAVTIMAKCWDSHLMRLIVKLLSHAS